MKLLLEALNQMGWQGRVHARDDRELQASIFLGYALQRFEYSGGNVVVGYIERHLQLLANSTTMAEAEE